MLIYGIAGKVVKNMTRTASQAHVCLFDEPTHLYYPVDLPQLASSTYAL